MCSARGDWNTYRAAIVTAHQQHAFEACGQYVGMIFVEPESREGQLLRHRCLGQKIASIEEGTVDQEAAALFTAYRNNATDGELVDAARAVIAKLVVTTNTLKEVVVLDRRIKRARELIRERITDAILLSEIADVVCLSPDRFRHLFIEETGIRFRPYVLWLRIEVALTAYTTRKSLTEASHAGGFADSAHFSRTFKRMFGFAPSSIQLE